MLAMMVAALSFTACGDDNKYEDFFNGLNSYTLFITNQDGKEYHTLPKEDRINWIGHLFNESDKTTVTCMMTGAADLHIFFQPNDLTLQDFYPGCDLGTPELNFGLMRSYSNRYRYESGSISVIKNDGSHFILKFDNYFTRKLKYPSKTILVNGTLEVEQGESH